MTLPDPSPTSSQPDAALMPSLRRLVRGLTALFWGLPLALLVMLPSTVAEMLRALGPVPPVAAAALLFLGLRELGRFRPQERAWTNALDASKLYALINLGLSPFVFFWNHLPGEGFYSGAVLLLALTGVLFLISLNRTLRKLTEILPDAALRAEGGFFTRLNSGLLLVVVLLAGTVFVLRRIPSIPGWVAVAEEFLWEGRRWLLLGFVLLPLSTTLTLIWKTREAVMSGVFGPQKPGPGVG